MVVQDQDNLFSGPLTKDSVSLEWQTVMEKIVCGGFEPRIFWSSCNCSNHCYSPSN